jgi:archaellum component FlaG (FlaF/FlaG flagellin family)
MRYFSFLGGGIFPMYKGAIAIFAFCIFLFSCAAQVTNTTQPPPPYTPPSVPQPVLPSNLTISDISLSETGKIQVLLSNTGKGPAPYGIGSLTIYVDGLLQWKESLGTLPDQSFLEPGGTTLYTTPVELVGKHEVRAVLDKEEKPAEKEEFSKIFPKASGKEALEAKPLLPDLAITDLFLTAQKELVVVIVNSGDSPLPLEEGNLKILVDGSLKGSYALRRFSDQPSLPVKASMTLMTPLVLVGRHEVDAQVGFPNEVKESNGENNHLKKILEGLNAGPDIVIKQLELTEDFELTIILSNAGEVDLRKGAIFKVQVFVNDQKLSEFDHFISEALKANLKNRYIIAPPYQIGIVGISKVKVSISPELPSDDIHLENNIIERTFVIFPFKIKPQGKEEFTFSFFAPRLLSKSQTEKVTIEARWVWGGSSLKLSFKKPGGIDGIPTLTGKSPLKVEFPILLEEVQKESAWSIFMTNLAAKKIEGHLIIQHP